MTTAIADRKTEDLPAGPEAEALAIEFGTPLYVYDFDAIGRRVAALREALPAAVDVAYAVKANPSLGVVAHLAKLGLGADVASLGELQLTLRAGIEPGRIVFTGPGKRDDELEAAVRIGIRAVTVESIGELRRLQAIAARLDTITPVMLRLATTAEGGTYGVAIGGEDGGKFGIDRHDLRDAALMAAASPHLRLIGLHAFGASNVLDADVLADHAERTARAAIDLIRQLEVAGLPTRLELIDVGGGLGIPYAAGERPLDLGRLGRLLARLASEVTRGEVTRNLRLLVEPGRFLVGPAGTYLTRVIDRKRIGRRDVVVVDGGIHHLVRPALVGGQHRIVNMSASAASAAPSVTVTVAGPLCSDLDVLGAEVTLAGPNVGDLLAVLDTGAYGYTEAMPLFLSHPVPAEVAISGGRAALLRQRIEPLSWLEAQRLPAWKSTHGAALTEPVTARAGSPAVASAGRLP